MPNRRTDSGTQTRRAVRASSSTPVGGQCIFSPLCGTGEDMPGLFSISATRSSIAARKASGEARPAFVMISARITPRREGIGENRHESPARSGRVPGAVNAPWCPRKRLEVSSK